MSDDQDQDVFETADLDGGSEFEDFEGGKKSFGELLNTNPMMKVGLVVGVIALIAGSILLFGGEKEVVSPSQVARPAELKQTPGQEKVSAEYEKAMKEKNEADVQTALETGTSAMPVPISTAKGRVEMPTATTVEDPLERWRRVQEERLQKEEQAQAAVQAQIAANVAPATPQRPPDPFAEAKAKDAEAFSMQMESIMASLEPKKPQLAKITEPSWLEEKRAAAAEKQEVIAQQQAAATAAQVGTGETLQAPGQIEYAQLLLEANTDSPGPVLAELVSGNLAGSRMIGTFDASDEYLTLKFSSVIVDGVALSTEAIAIDPATSKPGMITEIDHKYFQRIILPAAASFIEGIGAAIGESGSTTVSAGEGTTTSAENELDPKQEFFKGVEKAAEKVTEVLDEDANSVKPMLRLAAGTHLGILFLQPVKSKLEAGSSSQNSQLQMLQQQILQQQQQAPQQILLQLPQASQAMQGLPSMPMVPQESAN